MKAKLKNFKCLQPYIFQIALITTALSLLVQPIMEFNNYGLFNKFGRVFGNATLCNIDAGLRANNVLFFNTLIIPLFCILSCLIVYAFVYKTTETTPAVRDFLNTLTMIGCVQVFVYIYGKYNEKFSDIISDYAFFVIAIVFFNTFIYIRKPNMIFENYKFSVYLSIAISFLANIFIQNKTTIFNGQVYGYAIIYLFVFLMCQSISKHFELNRLQTATIPLFFGTLAAGLVLEFTNILNQHNIFIQNRLLIVKVIIFCMFFLTAVIFFLNKKMGEKAIHISLIGLVTGISFFKSLPPLVYTAGIELFEQANHGMLSYDALAWGKIPVINSFDGHMLSNSLGCFLFGLLNNETVGASYVPNYLNIFGIFTNIITFLLLKELFDRNFALLFILFIPTFQFIFPSIGIIAVFALINALKNNNTKSYVMLYLSIVFLLLYEVPTGISYGGATFIIMFVFLLVQFIKEKHTNIYMRRSKDNLKHFIISFVIFVTVCGVIFVMLCLINSVNPISRTREFINLCLSTNNWSYSSIGDNTSRNYALCYSFLPIVAIIGSIWSIINFKKNNLYVTALSLFGAYFLNYSRALGRHSLAENSYSIVIWCCILGLMFLCATFKPKFEKYFFTLSGMILVLFLGVTNFADYNSILNSAYTTSVNSEVYYNGASEKVNRVDLSAPLETHKEVIEMINTFVPKDETYMDLSSNTMLYALTGHEKPVYINQSPLHLSGEFTQKEFIKEIESFGDKCNFALLGGNENVNWEKLDGIWTQYRYYYVYEYLYENYRPLCKSTDNFSLWVKKSKYDIKSAKLINAEMVSTDYDTPIMRSDLTDDNWTNGIMNVDNSIMLFSIEQENLDSLRGATQIYNGNNMAKVIKTELDSQWLRIKIDGDVHAFDSGITAVFGKVIKFELIDYDYKDAYSYDLNELPYIWGTYDKRKAWNNPIVEIDSDGLIIADKQSYKSYIMVTIEASDEEINTLNSENVAAAELSLLDTDKNKVMQYNFTFHSGKNNYIFRVSSDMHWNIGENLKLDLKLPIDLKYEIKVLNGD